MCVGVLVVPRMFGEARELAVFYVSRDAAKKPLSGAVVSSSTAGEGTLLDRQARKYVDSMLIRVFGAETFHSFEQSDAYDALMTRVEGSLRDSVPGLWPPSRSSPTPRSPSSFSFCSRSSFRLLLLVHPGRRSDSFDPFGRALRLQDRRDCARVVARTHGARRPCH